MQMKTNKGIMSRNDELTNIITGLFLTQIMVQVDIHFVYISALLEKLNGCLIGPYGVSACALTERDILKRVLSFIINPQEDFCHLP
jgi:hypothetical protein